MTTVELSLSCVTCKQPFTQVFPPPIAWDAVNALLAQKDPTCPECTRAAQMTYWE